MVRGRRSVGLLLGIALGGCSANAPLGSTDGVERTAIVGGANDSTDKPVYGILINNMALCSGTLIAPNLILTARHCVAPMSSGDAPVNCNTDTFLKTYAASGFLVTPYQDVRNTPSNAFVGATEVRVTSDSKFCGNDAALLILESNVPPATSPIIEPRVDSMPVTNEPFKAIGYGLNSPDDAEGTSAGIRRSMGNLDVGCVGADECAGTRATDSEWAANSPVCSGDSGGPALDADGKVIGIASRSDETCAVALYSAVAAFKDLIVEAGKDAAEQGGYDTPTWASGGASSGGTSTGGASSGGAPNAGTSTSGGKGGSAGNSGAGRNATGGASNAGTGGDGATGGSSNAGTGGRAASGGTTGNAGTDGASAGTAGSSAAGAPNATLPTLGQQCTSGCAEPNRCYSSTGKPPGECVPICSVVNKCPSSYRCVVELGVCAPLDDGQGGQSATSGPTGSDDDSDKKTSSGCGCRVVPLSGATGSAWQTLGVLALAAHVARRRRRTARA